MRIEKTLITEEGDRIKLFKNGNKVEIRISDGNREFDLNLGAKEIDILFDELSRFCSENSILND